jgi:hypothetical protein
MLIIPTPTEPIEENKINTPYGNIITPNISYIPKQLIISPANSNQQNLAFR